MDETSAGILQLGVLGLGPVWRCGLKAALLAEPERQRVVLVADQCRRRADDAAAELRCPSSPSPGRMLRHPEVDVLVLADPQWHGHWALEEAVRLGKPVLGAVPLGAEPAAVARLEPLLQEAQRTVHFVEPWEAPALLKRAKELQADALGPLREMSAEWATPEPRPNWSAFARMLTLIGDLAYGPVAAVQAIGGGDLPFALHLEGKDGWKLLLRVRPQAPRLELRVEFAGPRGSAKLRWPDRIQWRSGAAVHRERLRWRSPLPTALNQFHELVWNGLRDEVSHAAAAANGRVMQAAWKSATAEGARLSM